MKKLLLIFTCALLSLSLASCQSKPPEEHTHDFSCRTVSPDTLAEEASCLFPASYYFSCECGELDIESSFLFIDGEPLPHTFEDGICTECGEDDPDFFDEDGPIDLPIIPFE